jgi:hypothetical protein
MRRVRCIEPAGVQPALLVLLEQAARAFDLFADRVSALTIPNREVSEHCVVRLCWRRRFATRKHLTIQTGSAPLGEPRVAREISVTAQASIQNREVARRQMARHTCHTCSEHQQQGHRGD